MVTDLPVHALKSQAGKLATTRCGFDVLVKSGVYTAWESMVTCPKCLDMSAPKQASTTQPIDAKLHEAFGQTP